MVLGFVAGLIVAGSSDAEASGTVQYKAVDIPYSSNTPDLEKLLNQMAAQGWSLDHFWERGMIAVFRRET